MIVIGTAGHIDHGKSAIVKRLTGSDPDRLPEEKERGMTIDLGFAFYRTKAGEQIAFVDVPGHERFVKNMIAGAGGINTVMLVVAADDGWMPQSQEHFQVVRLLGIEHGIIVINKTDLVEPDWLDLLEDEIRGKTKGSFLEEAPVFRVSAQTGDGFDKLADYLSELPAKVSARHYTKTARIYIDRSFIMPGIGGVATGTLRGNDLALGQTVSVWPSLKKGKIRSLQSNNIDVEKAAPGQRTAVSITGLEKEYLNRGGVITDMADFTYLQNRSVLAISMEMLREAPVSLEDRRKVLLIVGTTEVTGEIRLFQEKEIKPGRKGMVFFKPDEPALALVGDHCIMRLPTPMVTLGGGQVVDHVKNFPRRKHLDKFEYLTQRISLELDNLVISELVKTVVSPSDKFLEMADYSKEQVLKTVDRLKKEGLVGAFNNYIFYKKALENATGVLRDTLVRHLSEKPHLKGLSLEEIQQLSPYDEVTTRNLLDYLVSNDELGKIGDKYNPSGRGMSLKGAIKQAYEQIMKELKGQPYCPPTLTGLAAGGKNHREAIKFIIESGEGYKCGSSFVFLTEAWNEIVNFIKDTLNAKNEMTVTELKDRFELSRKFVIPIFEETDRLKITRREGDKRIKGERFES